MVSSIGARTATTAIVIAFVASGACGATVHRPPPIAPASDEITLYRDVAMVRQRIELDLPASASTQTRVVAFGVAPESVVVLDRGGASITALHVTTTAPPPTRAPSGALRPTAAPVATPPTVQLDLAAPPRAGHYAITIGYSTDRLRWDAAYTMITTPNRDRAVLDGAIAIRNASGVAFPHARVTVVDAELAKWRTRTVDALATELVGGQSGTTPMVVPRELGAIALAVGETRIAMLAGGRPQRMRSVLVYDPIGTTLDNPGPGPIRDPALGASGAGKPGVTESFEVVRDDDATRGLPAGPVRLLERRADGALRVLGESRLFEPGTRVATVDTIAIGTAEGVTARRERRELTLDESARRLFEEFAITVTNRRAFPIEVVVREHLYRGQSWTLAYASVPLDRQAKEGAQQIALRSAVPANGDATILYTVVYTWSP